MAKIQQIIPNNPNFQFQVADVINKIVSDVVTRGDLLNAGIIGTSGRGSTGVITKPVQAGGGIVATPLPIMGFTANGAFASILLTWNDITQHGFSYVEVWRNIVDDLPTAVKVGTSSAPLYSDAPPDSKTSITYYYWVRAVNVNNIAGPFNGIAGTQGNTANDPAYALEILTGKITSTQLFGDLNSRINLIDNPGTGLVDATFALKNITDIQANSNTLSADAVLANAVAASDGIKAHFLNKANGATISNTVSIVQTDLASEVAARVQLEAKLNASTALYSTSSTAAADALNAVAGNTTAMQSQIDANTADINNASGVVSTKINAEASNRSNLQAAILGTTADPNGLTLASLSSGIIHEENAARVSADTALTNSISTLQAAVNSNTSSISSEQTARANADSALATDITTLQATTASNASAIQTEQTARATADTALASDITTLQSDTSNNAAAIQTEQTTRSAADVAMASDITTLQADTATNSAAIQTEQTVRATADNALTRKTDIMIAGDSASADAVLANAVSHHQAQAHAFSNVAAIKTEQATRITAIQAQASRIDTMLAGFVSADGSINSAIVQSSTNTLANANSAAASMIATLQTTVDGNTAAVQTHATSINGLQAEYAVKVDVNGHVSGFGLASGPESSEFIIRADRFSISAPGVGTPKLIPFIVDAATGITYIQGASIMDGTITNAQIKNAAIETLLVGKTLTAPIIMGGTVKIGTVVDINNGAGVWIDSTAGSGVFRAGDPLGDHIKWDGANLSITGNIIAYASLTGTKPPSNADKTKTIIDGGLITTGGIQGGQTGFNVGTGFFMGHDGNIPKFSIGDPNGSHMYWDGTNLVVDGDIIGKVAASTSVVYFASPSASYIVTSGPYNQASPLTKIREVTVWDRGQVYVRISGMTFVGNAGNFLYIRQNGVTVQSVSYLGVSSAADTPFVLLNIAAGDTIELWAQLTTFNSGGTINATLDIFGKAINKITQVTV